MRAMRSRSFETRVSSVFSTGVAASGPAAARAGGRDGTPVAAGLTAGLAAGLVGAARRVVGGEGDASGLRVFSET